jgi:hypothetical protein
MHRLAFTLFTSLAVAAAALGQEVKETVYTMVVTDTVRSICRQLRVPEPTGKLVLRTDSTFHVSTPTRVRSGRYTQSKDTLAFAFDDQALSIGAITDKRVSLEGFTYERALPSFRPGQWTLRRNGSEDASVRFSFEPNGRFSYSGMQVSSKGTWKLEDDAVVLVWSEIDGQPVESGFTIKRRVPVGFGFFQIDSYRFEPKA